MPAKVDEIRKAIQKKNPGMSDSDAWAIAWSTYKKQSESTNKEDSTDFDPYAQKLYGENYDDLGPYQQTQVRTVVRKNPGVLASNLKTEAITIDIKKGDTILGGKFRNKKIVVEEISKNERGEPMINGKPILKVRLTKLHEFIIKKTEAMTTSPNGKLKLGDKVKGDMPGGRGKITNISQDWIRVRDINGEIHDFDEDDLEKESLRKIDTLYESVFRK